MTKHEQRANYVSDLIDMLSYLMVIIIMCCGAVIIINNIVVVQDNSMQLEYTRTINLNKEMR